MSAKNLYKTDLRKLEYSPDINPLLDSSVIPTRTRFVKSGLLNKDLADTETGEIVATSVIKQIEEKDSEEFVKIFAEGVARAYELTKTGQRVFQCILYEYENTPMNKGFVDAVYLAWFGDGLSGKDVGMSQYTFNRGMKELLDKEFLSPRAPNTYWINPALFFKGDRVLFIKEYRRKKAKPGLKRLSDNQDLNLIENI